jgi:hypothetical protein
VSLHTIGVAVLAPALCLLGALAAMEPAIARASPEPPLPNPVSPSVAPLSPAPMVRPPDNTVRPPDKTVRSPDDIVRSPDVDGLGVMSIRRGTSADVDVAFEHELEGNALAVTPGARLALPSDLFADLALPVGYERDAEGTTGGGNAALGNAMLGVGWLPASDRVVGVELRLGLPTSPRGGDGATTLETVAGPRIADSELWVPHTTSLELVADWRWRADAWWIGAEAGAAAWWQPSGYTTVVRATLDGGVRVAPWLDLAASFVTRLFVLSADSSDNFVHGIALGAIAHHGRDQLALRVELPVDSIARDDHRVVIGLELRAP